MEKQILINYKGQWTDIFSYLDVNDLFSLELSNKNIRNQLLNYYQVKTKNVIDNEKESNLNKKSLKKLFLSKYMNSLVIFNVTENFDSLEGNINNRSRTSSFNNENEINQTTNNSNKKKEAQSGTLVENLHTSHTQHENCMFSNE